MLNRIGDSAEPCNKPFLGVRSRLVCPALVLSLKLQFGKVMPETAVHNETHKMAV